MGSFFSLLNLLYLFYVNNGHVKPNITVQDVSKVADYHIANV